MNSSVHINKDNDFFKKIAIYDQNAKSHWSGFTHQLSAPHHQSGPLVSLYNLKLFSVSDTRKCFWDFGETVQKKSLMLSKEGGRITMQFHTFIAFHFAFVWDYRSHETPKKWIKRLIARELHQTRGLKFLCVACLVSKKKEHASGMLGAECISNVYSLGSQGL